MDSSEKKQPEKKQPEKKQPEKKQPEKKAKKTHKAEISKNKRSTGSGAPSDMPSDDRDS